MNRSILGMLLVAAFTVGIFFMPPDTLAQKKAGALAKKIQGTWVLLSVVNEQDGKKIDVYGYNPKGFVTFTQDGSYSLLIFREGLPKFASNNRLKGTAEENQAVVQGAQCHLGKYTVDEKEATLHFFPEAATFPNWVGDDQKRFISFAGDEMKMKNPTAAAGGTAYLVYKKVK